MLAAGCRAAGGSAASFSAAAAPAVCSLSALLGHLSLERLEEDAAAALRPMPPAAGSLQPHDVLSEVAAQEQQQRQREERRRQRAQPKHKQAEPTPPANSSRSSVPSARRLEGDVGSPPDQQ